MDNTWRVSKEGLIMTKPSNSEIPTKRKYTLSDRVDQTLYQQIVGCLMWIAKGTRPDIAFVAGFLGCFSSDLKECHMQIIRKMLAYLQDTASWGIMYSANGSNDSLNIQLYVDADWAGDRDNRVSTTGFVFLMAGGVVIWESKKEKYIAHSTAEAEYLAYGKATLTAAWVRKLAKELNIYNIDPITIQYDNQAAGIWVKDHLDWEKTRHIDIKYHYIQDEYIAGRIRMEYLSTENMIADILTKPVNATILEKHRERMGMIDVRRRVGVLLQDRLEVANKGLNTSEKEKNKQKSMIGYKEQKN